MSKPFSLAATPLLLATTLLLAPVPVRAQSQPESCTLSKGAYTCDWQAFRARFAQVHTVAIDAQPLERSTETQLRQLVASLGKSVATPDQPGDVVFRVVPAIPGGIAIGPSDQPLASLQIYARGPEGGHGSLLWVETFIGQADRPYPTVVNALVEQFENRFHKHWR